MEKVKKQNNRGVTLVALVVTIVLLLILATASTSVLFGDTGLILAAKQSKILTICAQIDEYVNMRLLENNVNAYSNQEIEFKEFIEDYIIPELIEQNLISNNLVIVWEEDYSIVTITDETNNIVTTINKTVGAYSESLADGYVSTKPTIEYTISPETENSNEVIITLNIKAENGLSKLECLQDGSYIRNYTETELQATETYTVKENGYFDFIVTDVDGRTATVQVKITNTSGPEIITYSLSTEAYTESLDLIINFGEYKATTGSVYYQTKVGDEEYKTAFQTTTITITENTTVHARYFDGTNGVQEIEIKVTNIANSIASKFESGDYVTYDSQTWQVLHDVGSYNITTGGTNNTIEIVYPENTETFKLEGSSDFLNLIEILNKNVGKYEKTGYSVASRHFGSNPEESSSLSIIDSIFNYNENDNDHYQIDTAAYNAANIEFSHITLMAARGFYYNEVTDIDTCYVRVIYPDGNDTYALKLWMDNEKYIASLNNDKDNLIYPGLAPVISLDLNLKTTDGDGSKENPYNLVIAK